MARPDLASLDNIDRGFQRFGGNSEKSLVRPIELHQQKDRAGDAYGRGKKPKRRCPMIVRDDAEIKEDRPEQRDQEYDHPQWYIGVQVVIYFPFYAGNFLG